MQCVDKREYRVRSEWDKVPAIGALMLAMMICGCSGTSSTSQTATQKSPQTYLAPFVAGTTAGGGVINSPQTYTIDDVGDAFWQTTYILSPPRQQGAQVVNSGVFTTSSRGLLGLGVKAAYNYDVNTSQFVATPYNPPKTGSYAIELAGQAGGLVQLLGQPVAPLVPTSAPCPDIGTSQTYQFVTIPGALIKPGVAAVGTWNPVTDTAYGSVDISTSGSTVSFANIKQFTLPSVGGSGAPSNPSASSITGACGQTAYGNAISVPGQVVITNPGSTGSHPPQAILSIGSSGLLVEDNGDQVNPGNSAAPVTYQNALGAGTGAVGLPKPSAALNTGTVVGAQYLGFIYGAGTYPGNNTSPTGWSSHLASFGFASVPSSCASVAAGTSTLIYGGDFTNDDPSTSSNGFGNCDVAVDLGTQDAMNYGLYPNAKVWIAAGYSANTTNITHSFQAVAIAGQLQGKYAIFVLGIDSQQPWAIYLMQSN